MLIFLFILTTYARTQCDYFKGSCSDCLNITKTGRPCLFINNGNNDCRSVMEALPACVLQYCFNGPCCIDYILIAKIKKISIYIR